jgi:hypothetical protein
MSPSSGGGELTLFRVFHASDHAPVWIELAGGNRCRIIDSLPHPVAKSAMRGGDRMAL